jgi:hypothetical protein
MSLSDARIRANQQNAAHSTGPKTEAGKDRARGNALKHGLRAETVLLPDDLKHMRGQMDAWTADLKPDGAVQTWLVAHAAAASIRVDRCLAVETAALGKLVRKAIADWTRKRRARVRKRATHLDTDPAGTVARLKESAYGCDWLLTKWGWLEHLLREAGAWDEYHEPGMAIRRGSPP